MLRVLLVDDEPFILQGLAMMIDWQGEGFEIIGKVSNAKDALEVLRKENPHLVIADIKMPEMTGLEFLEKVRREKLSDAYFVILSGYSDFDYVHTALLNECLDYMLKPVNREELLMILGRVRTLYEQSEKKRRDDSQKEKNIEALMMQFFLGFEIDERDVQENPTDWGLTDKRVEKHKIDELIHAIAMNDREVIESGTRQLLEDLERMDERVINMVVNYLMFELIHLAYEQDKNVNQQEVFRFIGNSMFEQLNPEGADTGMVRLLSEYGNYLAQLRGNQSKGGVLGQIETDLKENFSENLTLKDLSKKYYVNAAYLGQIFKKQYGESFKDYLNRIRIEEAAELLLKTDKKVYEIAEEVGYRDLDYFINKFIGMKGCTPAKFRKQIK